MVDDIEQLNYDKKIFTVKENSESGEVDNDTFLYFHQEGKTLWGEYYGGSIRRGSLIGTVGDDGVLNFVYQYINKDMQIKAGKCESTPTLLDNGRMELRNQWEWLVGDRAKGTSVLTQMLKWSKDPHWLDLNETDKQEAVELRLYAPVEEPVWLRFDPFMRSPIPGWNPSWEEWHCYRKPLVIFKQDYQWMLEYFKKPFPTKDAFDGTEEPYFDVCSMTWIGKNDWKIIIKEIEDDFQNHTAQEKEFLTAFLEWVKEALKCTDIIVVDGNQ